MNEKQDLAADKQQFIDPYELNAFNKYQTNKDLQSLELPPISANRKKRKKKHLKSNQNLQSLQSDRQRILLPYEQRDARRSPKKSSSREKRRKESEQSLQNGFLPSSSNDSCQVSSKVNRQRPKQPPNKIKYKQRNNQEVFTVTRTKSVLKNELFLEKIPTIIQQQDLESEDPVQLKKSQNKTSSERVQINEKWYFAIAICFTMIPVINLFLVYAYPYAIDKGPKTGEHFDPQGHDESAGDFSGYYIVLTLYTITSAVLITYTICSGEWQKRLKLFLMVDTLLIAEVSSAISYGALHIEYFCGNYYNNRNANGGPTFVVIALDVLVILMYTITNFAMVATVRSLLVYSVLRRMQVLGIKMLMMLSSMTYIGIGIMFLFGRDPASAVYLREVDSTIFKMRALNPIDQNPEVVNGLFDLTNLNQFINAVENFVLLYVFTNFGFIFEIFKKITDFDGSADLKNTYQIGVKEKEEEYQTQ